MGNNLTQEQIDKAVEFHGHWCPGLAIGLRASEFVLSHLGRARDEDVVALVETDMCGVDGIQVLTGCTLGKGNLIFQDHGKMAFTFYRRTDDKALRLVFDADRLGGVDEKYLQLTHKQARGETTPQENEQIISYRELWSKRIMQADLEQVFKVQDVAGPPPRKARILVSLACEDCGEKTMESRTRSLEGRTLCIPCFEKREKRI